MTKRIRPRLNAPAAVVNDPSTSALTDVSQSASDRDKMSNLDKEAKMLRDVEEDGAIGNGIEIRYRRRASNRLKRRHRLDEDTWSRLYGIWQDPRRGEKAMRGRPVSGAVDQRYRGNGIYEGGDLTAPPLSSPPKSF